MINGPLDHDALKEAARRLAERFEILRTTFHRPPGLNAPLQMISATARLSWRQVDLTRAGGSLDEAMQELQHHLRGPSLDWERGPALHLTLGTVESARHLLVIELPNGINYPFREDWIC